MNPHTQLSQAELRKAIEHITPFTYAFDLVREHIVITDRDAHILYANAAAEKATGFTLAEMLGKNPADLWGGRMPEDFYKKMWDTLGKKQAFVGDVQNVQKDGTKVWQEIRISPVLDAQNNVDFFIAIESIISDRKQDEQTKEDITSVISHEALSPLTDVRWTLENLEEQKLPASVEHSLKELSSQSERAINMLHDLASVSRAGQGYPTFEVVDLGSLIQHVCDQISFPCEFVQPTKKYTVVTVPLLATEFFTTFFTALNDSVLSLKKVECSIKDEEQDALVIIRLTATYNANIKDIHMHAASLIARYLHWGALHMEHTKDGVEWSVRIPLQPHS